METRHLRTILSNTISTPQSIQKSASALMKYYDTTVTLAVTEWRNSLQTAKDSNQRLALLYVVNEVLQTSKRNRGPKFLEAFGPVLKSSLSYICEQDQYVTEKVRRTAKIWGDRRVFSTRFITDILKGLDAYRDTIDAISAKNVSSDERKRHRQGSSSKKRKTMKRNNVISTSPIDNDTDDDLLSTPRPASIQLDVNIEKVHITPSKASIQTVNTQSHKKRNASSSPQQQVPPTLLQLFQKLNNLSDKYSSCVNEIASLDESIFQPKLSDSIVGDELLSFYKNTSSSETLLKGKLKIMHDIANEFKNYEKEAIKYIPILKLSIQNDKDDLRLCDTLEESLINLQTIIGQARKARTIKIQKLEEKKKKEELSENQRIKEEERRSSLQEILVGKNLEAKPGMVWNATTREYQEVLDPTQDSWRD